MSWIDRFSCIATASALCHLRTCAATGLLLSSAGLGFLSANLLVTLVVDLLSPEAGLMSPVSPCSVQFKTRLIIFIVLLVAIPLFVVVLVVMAATATTRSLTLSWCFGVGSSWGERQQKETSRQNCICASITAPLWRAIFILLFRLLVQRRCCKVRSYAKTHVARHLDKAFFTQDTQRASVRRWNAECWIWLWAEGTCRFFFVLHLCFWMVMLSYASLSQVIAGNETPVLLHDLPSVIAESDVPSFLAPYGYKARPHVFLHASWLLYVMFSAHSWYRSWS